MLTRASTFLQFLAESRQGREQAMLQGIAEILLGVHDLGNRRELAEQQLQNFSREGIQVEPEEFLRACGLDK